MSRQRTVRKPLILFGEGPTEGLFLERIKQLYSKRLADKIVTVGSGSGGSSGSVLLELKKKHLVTGNGETPALVLIDADNGLDQEARDILKEYTNKNGECRITVVYSEPQCLEGLLLDLLDDLPPKSRQTSDNLKKYFQDNYLGSRDHVRKNFKMKRADLFPQQLLDQKITSHPVMKEVSLFLGLTES